MKNIRIDLFSDTITKPTQGMRKFMAEAEVGDEQQKEDPSVNKLVEMVCDLLGKEDRKKDCSQTPAGCPPKTLEPAAFPRIQLLQIRPSVSPPQSRPQPS